MESMETTVRDLGDVVRVISDEKGKKRTIRIKEVPKIEPPGGFKRPRPRSSSGSSSDDEIKKRAEVDTSPEYAEIMQTDPAGGAASTREALIEVVTSVRTQIGKMEAALSAGDEAALKKIIRSLKQDADSAIIESHRAIERACWRCEGAASTASVGTQTARTTGEKLFTEEIKKVLDNGATDEQVLQVVTSRWPEELFHSVKKGKEVPFQSGGDVAVIFDVATADAAFKNKLFRAAPGVKARSRDGKLVGGQLVMEGHSSMDLLGESEESEDRVFTIVVDTKSKDEIKTAADVWKAMRRLQDYDVKQFLATDDKLGQITRNLLEYEARRANAVVHLTLEKRTRETKEAKKPGIPTTRVTVKADGRSFADLLRDMKTKVNKEETGEVLSVKKGPRDELQLTLKAGKAVDEIKKVIGNKVEGAVVKEVGRKIPPVLYHIKGLDLEATTEDIKEGFSALIGEEEIRISALRPAFGGTQNATVLVPGLVAKKLQDVSRIQIGWVCCRLVQRESETRCYRCWEFGHLTNGCKGVDRSKLCFNCGREGHVRATCEFSTRCVACGEEGHKMGNRSCQKARH